MRINVLIKKCQNGNKESFNELIMFYYPFVLKFLLKLVCNRDNALDLTQETFVKVINNIDRFNINGKASFDTYLISIAKNTYIDYLRKYNKELQEIDIESIPDKNNFEKCFFENEDFNFVLQKIEDLPFKQKEAIKLKYLEGYTLEEIAKIQRTHSKTVKSRLFEGRKRLKKNLKGTGIYE